MSTFYLGTVVANISCRLGAQQVHEIVLKGDTTCAAMPRVTLAGKFVVLPLAWWLDRLIRVQDNLLPNVVTSRSRDLTTFRVDVQQIVHRCLIERVDRSLCTRCICSRKYG